MRLIILTECSYEFDGVELKRGLNIMDNIDFDTVKAFCESLTLTHMEQTGQLDNGQYDIDFIASDIKLGEISRIPTLEQCCKLIEILDDLPF